MKRDIMPSREPEDGISAGDQLRVAFAGAVVGLVVGIVLWLLSGDSGWLMAAPAGAFASWGVAVSPPLIIR